MKTLQLLPCLIVTVASASAVSGCGLLAPGQSTLGAPAPATVTATVTAQAADDKNKEAEKSASDDKSDPETTVVTVAKKPQPTVTVVERIVEGGGGSRGRSVYGPRRMCASSYGVNSTTTCGFARNVWQNTSVSRYTSSTGAYSPTTGKWYDLSCSSNAKWLICRGGVNAEVFLRL